MYTMKGIVGNILFRVFGILPLQKKIVFSSFGGRKINDSPGAIFKKMINDSDDIKYVWLLEKSQEFENKNIISVKPNSWKAVYHMATATVWVDNVRKREWARKRKGQFYVQTWHSNLGLKKSEADVVDLLNSHYINDAKNDSKMADIFVSGSKWLTESYRRAFWFDGEIFESGTPRNDIFFEDAGKYYAKVKTFYKTDNDTKFLLYAPTFRDDFKSSLECYNVDYDQLSTCLKKRYGGKWKIIVRLHPNIADMAVDLQYNSNILNGNDYDEINELIMASDVLLTDYSSCMFDAMEAKKIVWIYACDLQNYSKDRGYHFELSELPFPIARNNNELKNVIQEFDENLYNKQTESFMQKMGVVDSQYSSEKVIERILKAINK